MMDNFDNVCAMHFEPVYQTLTFMLCHDDDTRYSATLFDDDVINGEGATCWSVSYQRRYDNGLWSRHEHLGYAKDVMGDVILPAENGLDMCDWKYTGE